MTYAVGTRIDLRPADKPAAPVSDTVKQYLPGTKLSFQFRDNMYKIVRHIPVVFA